MPSSHDELEVDLLGLTVDEAIRYCEKRGYALSLQCTGREGEKSEAVPRVVRVRTRALNVLEAVYACFPEYRCKPQMT